MIYVNVIKNKLKKMKNIRNNMDTNSNDKVKTNFEQVREFHERFDHTISETPVTTIFKIDPTLIKHRLGLITEEYTELQDSIKDHDFTEMVDALADMLYVIYGFGHSIGVDLDKAFHLVHQSNMTKLCKDMQEVQDTIDWYKETRPQYQPAFKRTKDDLKWIVYDRLTGKALKSKYYSPVKFDTLF